MDTRLRTLSEATGQWLAARRWRLATAESCTGGWIAEVVTATAGSSAWFDCGFVTYSNEAKQNLLGVPAATLERYGAVSEPTVSAMLAGALRHSRAEVAIAVSGIAGPGGATEGKPVGTVCIGWAARGGPTIVRTCHFATDFDADREGRDIRTHVRRETVLAALAGLPAVAA